MRDSFESPDDFLEYLKVRLSDPVPNGQRDSVFDTITRTELEDLQVNGLSAMVRDPERLQQAKALSSHLIIEGLLSRVILPSLNSSTRSTIEGSIAVGSLDCREVNAIITVSNDSKYAILINTGLMLFLNKYYKLVFAEVNPKYVVYCDRGSPDMLGSSDYKSYRSELVHNYVKHKLPKGALVKLESSITARSGIALVVSEVFVICHELGHFLNGDLEDGGNLTPFLPDGSAMTLGENLAHAKEFSADHTGFDLLRQVAVKLFRDKPLDIQLLLAVGCLFDALIEIGQSESNSHPDPIDRVSNLAQRFFGLGVARTIRESYYSNSALEQLVAE